MNDLGQFACRIQSDPEPPWTGREPIWQVSATYGLRDSEALMDVWGVASAPDGGLFVFDAGRGQITGLNSDFTIAWTSGRHGSGPGEFSYQRVLAGDWMTANDSAIFVLDLRGVTEFGLNGEYQRPVANAVPNVPRVDRIAIWNGSVVYALNDIDRADGRRALQTWHIDSGGKHELLRVDSIQELPLVSGRPVRGIYVMQAEPLWAVHGDCLFVSDGSSDWLIRAHLSEGLVDTIYLPTTPYPSLSDADRAHLERLRREASLLGIRVGEAHTRPTAPIKWNDMIVDAHGSIWLEPWRPESTRDLPFESTIVNPNTGQTTSLTLPVFPAVFASDWSFVARRHDPLRGEYLQRFEAD